MQNEWMDCSNIMVGDLGVVVSTPACWRQSMHWPTIASFVVPSSLTLIGCQYDLMSKAVGG